MRQTAPSLLTAALLCRCPRCGKETLFQGLLTPRDHCAQCGLYPRGGDSGDGAAALVILALGAIIVGMAFRVAFCFAPPLWPRAILWPVVTVPLAIAMIRPVRSGLIALRYLHRAIEMGL